MHVLSLFRKSTSSSQNEASSKASSSAVKLALGIAATVAALFTVIKVGKKIQKHRRISSQLNRMTLKEKVGQMLMVHFNGKTASEAEGLIQAKVGNIILYKWSNGLDSPEQVQKLTSGLQDLAKKWGLPPILISADQEGGIVNRLDQGFTIFPGNKALAMTNQPQLAERCGAAMGLELRSVGVNFNLAPVVDINSNPRNPVIGLRSFGETAQVVKAFGGAMVKGFHCAGIFVCLKHFPGHGETQEDSHLKLPVVAKTLKQLNETELAPFKYLASKVDAVMTSHILFPKVDKDHCATVSKPILDILRNEMGFKGVIISDSIVMEGFLNNCRNLNEGAVLAILAGCNMLILGGKQLIGSNQVELDGDKVLLVHQYIMDAVKSGRIPLKMINDSVGKILDLKEKITSKRPHFSEAHHRKLSQKIAELAVRIKVNVPVGSLANKTVAIFAPKILTQTIKQTSLINIGAKTSLVFLELNPNQNECETSNKIGASFDVIIFLAYNAWKNPSAAELINTLSKDKPLVLFVLRDPIDADLFPQSSMIITTFGPTLPSIEAGIKTLFSL